MRESHKILKGIKGLNFIDRLLMFVLRKYTYKIYKFGYIDGFNFKEQ